MEAATSRKINICDTPKGTEPPFTGEYDDTETTGHLQCVCCGQALFRSDKKFHSGFRVAQLLRSCQRRGRGVGDGYEPWDEAYGGEVQPL